MPAWAPIEVRLLRLSRDDPSGCRLWSGCMDVDGYGKFNGKHASTAHRSAYIEWVGEIPESMEVDHICRVRHCINPDHLRVVPHAVNVACSVRDPERHRNTRKTLCKRGHPLSGDNLLLTRSGARQCLICTRLRKRASERGVSVLEFLA